MPRWKRWLGLSLVGDVIAGFVANFTRGTNDYYAASPTRRWMFIGVHYHIIAIAYLLGGVLRDAWVIWAYTIGAAAAVNSLKGSTLQRVAGASAAGSGLLLTSLMKMPQWMRLVSNFFITKVAYSFAVDHYAA
eukprot:Hpha_TRINITY_DN3188_c0_g1::TRINITY_DN3188_c0_g1_i1::g.96561::m.96561